MQTAIQPTGLLTASDVARRLNMAKSGVYALLARGDISHFRIGRLVRIREADLDAFLGKCQVASVAQSPHLYAVYSEV